MTFHFLDRIRSPGARAVRRAGPPDRHVIAALIGGALIAFLLLASSETSAPIWLVFGLITGLTTGIVSVADRDGWRIRHALAYVALAQRGRWRRGALPRTVSQAKAWLDAPANAAATDLERATMLFSADRWDEARALLDRFVPSTDAERASLFRLRATVDGRRSGQMDMDPVREAVRRLDPAEARYQLTAAAWSQAYLDIAAGRPWRKRFADATRPLEPFEVPVRYRVWLAVQQLAAPIACVLASLIVGLFTGR